ncbi:hypothetical protein [uncultured Sphingomonas sp.]|uniref:hypothetical protein n=1 Tax=uncultured Sphingomonas sp. TaxID=158754 RepID=UPI0025D636D2|nr:hypothetical protein [uncultured Sphingomonas sp.]
MSSIVADRHDPPHDAPCVPDCVLRRTGGAPLDAALVCSGARKKPADAPAIPL